MATLAKAQPEKARSLLRICTAFNDNFPLHLHDSVSIQFKLPRKVPPPLLLSLSNIALSPLHISDIHSLYDT